MEQTERFKLKMKVPRQCAAQCSNGEAGEPAAVGRLLPAHALG